MGWKTFRELQLLFVTKVFTQYYSCVRTAILHGDETWDLNKEDVSNIVQNVVETKTSPKRTGHKRSEVQSARKKMEMVCSGIWRRKTVQRLVNVVQGC